MEKEGWLSFKKAALGKYIGGGVSSAFVFVGKVFQIFSQVVVSLCSASFVRGPCVALGVALTQFKLHFITLYSDVIMEIWKQQGIGCKRGHMSHSFTYKTRTYSQKKKLI